jgi:hypothetical protein
MTTDTVKLSGISTSVCIYTAGTSLARHCEFGGGEISLKVTGAHEPNAWQTPSVYLHGTPEELRTFAVAIVAALPVERLTA